MRLRFICTILVVGLVGAWCKSTAAQKNDPAPSNPVQQRLERLLQSIAASSKLDGAAWELIPDLIALVESGETQESDLARRALASMGPKARSAIAAIGNKLGDPTHATRGAAVDALVAIGETCEVPMRKLLKSPTARTRAGATQVLSRLGKLDLKDLAQLAQDADPRVRGATANALSKLGKPGVAPLADLLQDRDLAVAVQAARGLHTNRSNAAIAVPRLTMALARADLDRVAVDALSAYGMAARQAIPAILKAHSLDRDADDALKHIGPPDVQDVLQICENLKRDEEARILVAKTLGSLGLDGKAAANALEAAAEKSIADYVELVRNAKAQGRERHDNSGRVFVAGEYCATAVWDVTHDTGRFLNLLEKLAIAADCPIRNSRRAPMKDLSPEGRRLVELMLRHSNINVQFTALSVLPDIGPIVEPLKKVLLELARGRNAELARQAIASLVAVGPKAASDVAPVLISRFNDGTLPLKEFADAIGRLEIRSPESQAILERGLKDKDRWTARACATALCITSNEKHRIARLIIDTAGKGAFENYDAVLALGSLKGGDDVVIPFLVKQLDSEDYWTRHHAIAALGALGPKVSSTIPKLKKLLNEKELSIRLTAARAVFEISDNATDLEKLLDAVFAKDERYDRYQALEAIEALNRSGGRFERYPLLELRRSPPELAEAAIKALRGIGTKDAIAALRQMAESSDWMIRSQAAQALDELQKPNRKRGN